jgi:transcriptional regulator GlxA family with amidase domain
MDVRGEHRNQGLPEMGLRHGPQRVAFVLVPNFSMLAFTAAIEPLRIANRLAGRELYSWQVVAKSVGPMRASNGVLVMTDRDFGDVRRCAREVGAAGGVAGSARVGARA